jgi:hypothetical protein
MCLATSGCSSSTSYSPCRAACSHLHARPIIGRRTSAGERSKQREPRALTPAAAAALARTGASAAEWYSRGTRGVLGGGGMGPHGRKRSCVFRCGRGCRCVGDATTGTPATHLGYPMGCNAHPGSSVVVNNVRLTTGATAEDAVCAFKHALPLRSLRAATIHPPPAKHRLAEGIRCMRKTRCESRRAQHGACTTRRMA